MRSWHTGRTPVWVWEPVSVWVSVWGAVSVWFSVWVPSSVQLWVPSSVPSSVQLSVPSSVQLYSWAAESRQAHQSQQGHRSVLRCQEGPW